MHFESVNPRDSLKELVKEIWVFENDDSSPKIQKIIPDGYSEIIIHYGDPYKINLNGQWELQSRLLFSSHISKYFFLQNTGKSGMIGIKLFPASFYELFGVNVADTVDKVLPLSELLEPKALPVISEQFAHASIPDKVHLLENWLAKQPSDHQSKVRAITQEIMDKHGMVDLEKVANGAGISLRQAERLYKRAVGISPKFFSRIVRFNYIFKVMETHEESWIRVALQSGYFDQSHFIKNFKEFTGEEPSNYGFEAKNLANFFLKD